MELRYLHSEAMDMAEKAMIERARGNLAAARIHLQLAFEKEQEAARMAVDSQTPEPTRSILLKSAAHLAIDVGDLRSAERLIGTALAGDAPEELAQELRSLFEEIGFQRHLELRGVQLQRNDVQMVLVGAAVAPGMIASDEFLGRVRTLRTLVHRTSESDMRIAYRQRGEPKEEISKQLQLFLSVPRAASFAVSLRVASANNQAEFGFAQSSVVLATLLDRLEMFERADLAALHVAIPGKEYFDNFVELASELGPDGKQVRMVGFTSVVGDIERRVQMTRPHKASAFEAPFVASEKPLTLTGRLSYFKEDVEGNTTLRLRTSDGNEFRLKASDEELAKAAEYIGKKRVVTITGRQASQTAIEFDTIKPVPRKGARKRH